MAIYSRFEEKFRRKQLRVPWETRVVQAKCLRSKYKHDLSEFRALGLFR